MIAPTPGSSTSPAVPPAASAGAAAGGTDAARTPTRPATPDWTSTEDRARAMLEKLGRADHPDAEHDPIQALYQVAVDFRCSAHGYRELYLHHVRHA